ncbi:Vacuolar protein-sorting-associated protein 36 [Nymphon striatum]|nr:Vacuolar protein-sorting-associated protein 36 [Nymphon striatum]
MLRSSVGADKSCMKLKRWPDNESGKAHFSGLRKVFKRKVNRRGCDLVKRCTQFDTGNLNLTSHILVWTDYSDQKCCIRLNLSLIIFTEEVASTFSKSAKIILHLDPVPATKSPGPIQHSPYCHVKLSFKKGGANDFYCHLSKALQDKKWQNSLPPSQHNVRKVRAGIVGIERQIQAKNQQTVKNISRAFDDLKNLIDMAKDMVTLSKAISNKIRDKQGDITEDETVKFKSYLLSLGIDDPVTRDSHGSSDMFHRELARQVAKSMEQPIKDAGGIMALPDVYCRLNRARGLELVSPDDLLNACKLLENLHLPVCYKVFESGVVVLQLQSHNEAAVIKETAKLINERTSMTSGDLSQIIGISVVLAKERLLATEKHGLACRDKSVEGLKFYPNLFLTCVE